MLATASAEQAAWARYLETLRQDVAPPSADYRGNYEYVERFAWLRLQEDLRVCEHDPE